MPAYADYSSEDDDGRYVEELVRLYLRAKGNAAYWSQCEHDLGSELGAEYVKPGEAGVRVDDRLVLRTSWREGRMIFDSTRFRRDKPDEYQAYVKPSRAYWTFSAPKEGGL